MVVVSLGYERVTNLTLRTFIRKIKYCRSILVGSHRKMNRTKAAGSTIKVLVVSLGYESVTNLTLRAFIRKIKYCRSILVGSHRKMNRTKAAERTT